ncbi:MAG: GntR family transcriptional regulator [Ilumatobacteraceae bacterium]
MSRLDAHQPEARIGKVKEHARTDHHGDESMAVIEPIVPSSPLVVRIGRAHRPLRRAVYEEIQRRIVDGRFQQGERIFEDQVAQELDVSRNPVREALQALESEGFVELEPRRGARVAMISTERANELFELREALEGMVARLAAQRRTPVQLHGLQHLVQLGADAAGAGDLAALPALNTEFHRRLGDAANNSMLADSVERMSQLIQWVYTKRITQRGSKSWTEHLRIVDAIADGDPDRAFSEACEHISNARRAYVTDQLAAVGPAAARSTPSSTE